MESLTWVLLISQLVFTFIAGAYFFGNLRSQSSAKNNICTDSKEELDKLKVLRKIKLPEPLTEITRPTKPSDIIGQESGTKALKNAICSPNPQHVIIYGPPGVGKTAAARIILEEAKTNPLSPFSVNSPFIELDATILQFDERSIADPLMGSVHDPIYHGAGSYGQAGVPQPKPGAVTNAHGGILFIDEIGELHNHQMNKLLKVLEDRKILLFSSYYSKSNKNIPKHIHDIFTNGFPADFRLIGATTKMPEDIPPALRSRCREIFFKPLSKTHMENILISSIKKVGLIGNKEVYDAILEITENGRDIVSVVQSIASQAIMENRTTIELSDIYDIMQNNKAYRIAPKYGDLPPTRIGVASTPVIDAYGKASIIEIEAAAMKNISGMPQISISGIGESEEIISNHRRILKKSGSAASVYNALAALKNIHAIDYNDYDIYINFTGDPAADGLSVGCAVFCALYSSVMNLSISSHMALIGEMSITGTLKPVGGILEKIEASKSANLTTIVLPNANFSEALETNSIRIVEIDSSAELIRHVFTKASSDKTNDSPNLKIIHAFPSHGEN